MSAEAERQDLIVLVADDDAVSALNALLTRRTEAMGIRRVRYELEPHPQRDPGCFRDSHNFLRSAVASFEHALVVFDRHGCGREEENRGAIEQIVEERLKRNGWDTRCAVVVIDPELEAWVWSDSSEVDRVLGWAGQSLDLRTSVQAWGFWVSGESKPSDPKQAMERALRTVRKGKSSKYFGELASSLSLRRCTDPSFIKLRTTLQTWFPA